jgi:hypothetical protein
MRSFATLAFASASATLDASSAIFFSVLAISPLSVCSVGLVERFFSSSSLL